MGLLDFVDLRNVLLDLHLGFGKKGCAHSFENVDLVVETGVQLLVGRGQTRTQLVVGLLEDPGFLLQTSGDVFELVINHI